MALQALWAPETQFQNKNGSLLVQGKIYVQYRGRSQLAKTYRDADGTYLNPNPLLTDNDGRVLCFADDAFSYTAVVCDFYGNELFSFDPIPCGSGSGSGSSSGSSAQHWIGINGQTQQISRNTYTRLKLPSGLDNVDYEGDFVLGTIKGSGTEMVLKDGLYLVNTVIRFKQSSDDLTNTLSNVIIHTRDFDTPNIQEVGAVVRDEAGPDASEEIHTITLTYIRHVSQDDVGSDRIKFAVETPNTWSECYIQNLQIAKLGSSVGGGGTASIYSPGDYISIENDTISVTGIEPENYATHDELLSATSAFITSADLPDLSSYATEQWVLDKHYITSADIPDIPDDLVTSAELAQTSGLIEQDIADLTSAVAESLADKMDKSSSADFYPRYDNPEGYLTSIPSEYVTESEMSGYVQGQTSGFITSADLPDVSDMATKTWVTEQHYITSADVPPQVEYSAGDNIDITNHVVSVTDTSLLLAGKNVSITPSGDNYVISAQVSGTSGYVTEQEMNDAIQSATSAFLTSADLPDLSDYATESYVQSEVSGKADKSEIPSLVGYATEQYVQDNTSAFVDSEYVTEYVTSQTSGKQDQLTFEYNEESAISAINGSALAGGSSFDPSVLSSYIPYSATYIAAGSSNTASSNSLAVGTSNKASTRSLAIGQSSSGSTNSIGVGRGSNGANYSVAVGQDSYASYESIAVGISNNYANTDSIAVGTSNRATIGSQADGSNNNSNWCSLSQGDSNVTNGNSIAVGMANSATSGAVAVGRLNYAYSGQAFGLNVKANHGMVIGEYNYDSGAAFGIGRGTGKATRADIFRINQSGDAYKVVGSGEGTSYKYLNEYDLSLDGNNKIVGIDGYDIAGGGGGGSYTAGEFIDITNDVISVDSGDVSNLIPGSGILITQSSAGTEISIDPDETLIWTGSAYTTMTPFELLEPISNFRRIKTVTKPERVANWRAAQISEFQFPDVMIVNNYIQWKTESLRSNSLNEEVWYIQYDTSAQNSFYLRPGIRMINGGAATSGISEYSGALIEIYGLDRRS